MAEPHRVRSLPSHASDVWMFAGIFLMFGALGPMIALLHDPPGGWMYALVLQALAGALAVGWSVAFQRRGRWYLLMVPLVLVPAVGMPLVMPRIWHWGLFRVGEGHTELWRRIIALSMAMGGIAIGFTLVIRYLMRVERAGARARAELSLAAQIHASLVPAMDASWNGVRVLGSSEASGDMGGDLIDAVAREGCLDLFLADVSGHGVRAGVVMGMVKATLRTALAGAPERGGDIRGHMSTLNRVLGDLVEASMFATAVWVRFESGPAASGRRATIVVAGHPPVFRYEAATGAWSQIDGSSLPLGVVPGEEYQSVDVALDAGDMLVLYTDGLTEAAAPDGRQLGVSGLLGIVAGACGRGGDPRAAILADVRAGRASGDDQTLVVVRLDGAPVAGRSAVPAPPPGPASAPEVQPAPTLHAERAGTARGEGAPA